MITVRPSSKRGRSSTGWLHSAHSFSFGDYFDLRHQGHGNLLALNDDTVAPGKGFGTHGHRDMEIVSYGLEGALAHQDNLHERWQPCGLRGSRRCTTNSSHRHPAPRRRAAHERGLGRAPQRIQRAT